MSQPIRRCFAGPTAIAILLLARLASAAEGEIERNVEYGAGGGEKLTLHLAKPKEAAEPSPCIVVIHGGGWAGGNKDLHLDLIEKFAERGYVSVSVGYRLAPAHRFPAQVHDVKCAVRWIRAHAEELNVDPQRIGAIGFSAGAHLSMMLGTVDPSDGLEGEGGWADQSSKVSAVVAYFGPTNLAIRYPDASRGLVEQFIGGTLEEKAEDHKQASPITFVDKNDAPMLLFQGTKDVLVPHDQAIQMAEALSAAGVPGRVEIMLGANHGWGGRELERTVEAGYEFFDSLLNPPSAAAQEAR